MTFTSTTAGADHPTQASGTDQAAAPTAASLSNHNTVPHTRSSLGLLHDDNFGTHPVESKDITILRRLKLAILEGQHPYFKAKADLSNLQDLFLASGSRSMGPGAHQPGVLDPTLPRSSGHTRRNPPPALDDLGSSGPATLDYGNDDGNDASETSPVRDPPA
ncbi:hypothetical protein OPQ81_005411 [Rhizoctonia solani]|nr:hypothetical protein OPQ81_005411 [Rhizoctonia solani]